MLRIRLTLLPLILLACAGSGMAQGKPSGQTLGTFDGLKMTSVQQCMFDLMAWKQSISLQNLGGLSNPDFNNMSTMVQAARLEVTRASSLYIRAMLDASQQAHYDDSILDLKRNRLPAHWKSMKDKGTQVSALLRPTKEQEAKAKRVLDTFRSRNSAIWGTGFVNGGYARNLNMLEEEFKAILSKEQLSEFSTLWKNYNGALSNAERTAKQ